MSGYRYSELQRLAQIHGLQTPTPLSPLPSLSQADVPDFSTANDDERANQSLLQRKASKQIRKPLFRTKSRLESYEYKNITAELLNAVQSGAEVGTIQALLKKEAKLEAVKNLETRTAQLETRDGLLQQAVQSQNLNLVWVLAPITSPHRKNDALRSAIDTRNDGVILKLLQYGANPNHCSEAFLEAAAKGDIAIIEWLLQSPRNLTMSNGTLIDATMLGVKSGSLHLLQRIVAAADLSGQKCLEGCREAAISSRLDMLLTLLLDTVNIDPEFLASIILEVFNSTNVVAGALHPMLETFLFAGAHGNDCSAALGFAVEMKSLQFVELFVDHGVDINWGQGRIACKAAALGSIDMLRTLLGTKQLSRSNASQAAQALPQHLNPDIRLEIMSLLLDAGATGPPVENELVLAVKSDHVALVRLLRGRGTSIDARSGDALVAAVQNENIQLLQQLLEGPVGQSSLQAAFPFVSHTSKAAKLPLTKLFLQANIEGPVLGAALREAVCDAADDRDECLIEALIAANADPVFDNAQVLRYAITHQDSELFSKLLDGPAQVSESAISELLPIVITVPNRRARFSMVKAALRARPQIHATSNMLLSTMKESDLDGDLIQIITGSNLVDINHNNGALLIAAADLWNMSVLKRLTNLPNRSRDTTTRALVNILQQSKFDDHEKAQRSALLLDSPSYVTCATQGFRAYADFWIASHATIWPLETFQTLLDAGSDITSLCECWERIARCCVITLIDNMTKYSQTAACIDAALQGACQVDDEAGRAQLVSVLLSKSPSVDGLSRALIRCCEHKFVGTLKTLLCHGARVDLEDFAAIRKTIQFSGCRSLQALLEFGISPAAVVAAFEEAKKTVNTGVQYAQMKLLVPNLTSNTIDPYLFKLLRDNAEDRMIELLLDHGANVHYQNDAALKVVVINNNLDRLEGLMRQASERSHAASNCIETCLDGQLVTDAFKDILVFLVACHPAQAVLDRLLLRAGHELKRNGDLLDLISLLVDQGADTNFDQGATLCQSVLDGHTEAVSRLAKRTTNTTRSRALHFLIQTDASEADVERILHDLIAAPSPSFKTFIASFPPPLKAFLTKRSQSPRLLQQLLCPRLQILSSAEDILFWAINHGIDEECLELMIKAGANTKYRDFNSGETVLLLAIRSGMSITESLLRHGADTAVADEKGLSPLLLCVDKGDASSAELLMQAGAPKNDGSLHQAAGHMNVEVLEILLRFGHDPNHPSPRAQGRTPMVDLAYRAKVDHSSLYMAEKTLHLLLQYGADFRRKMSRRPLIYWAFDNPHPTGMVEALMQAFLYKHIDEDCNLLVDGGFVYSPTMYLLKRGSTTLLNCVKTFGANRDVYYALQGNQPDDAVGMPFEIAENDRLRRAKEAKLAEEEAEYRRKLQRMKDAEAEEQLKIKQRHELNQTLAKEAEEEAHRRIQERHSLRVRMQNEEANMQLASMQRMQELEQERRENDRTHARLIHRQEIEKSRQLRQLETDMERDRADIRTNAFDAHVNARRRLLDSQGWYYEQQSVRHRDQGERDMQRFAYEKAAAPLRLPYYSTPRGYIAGPADDQSDEGSEAGSEGGGY